MTHQQSHRVPSRRPSFILVGKEEEKDVSCFSVLGNMGLPILYVICAATTLIGIICMSLITKYWSELSPPTCFLYTETASAYLAYQFGTNLSTCYWVAYGGIFPLFLCSVCGVFYIFHVKDDKVVTPITYGCVITMFISTLFLLAVACTFAQGMRITCANITLNPANNKARSCKELLDIRVEGFNLPVQTSSMITASMVNIWIAVASSMLITMFHIALIVRRKSAY